MFLGKNKSKYEKEKEKYEKEIMHHNKKQEEYNMKIKTEKQKYDFKRILSKFKFETYTKRLIAFVVLISIIDLQFSYILAFLGREEIAETLSVQICTTLLGTVIVYVIRAYFDTKAEKHNEMIKNGYISEYNGRKDIVKKIKELTNKIENNIDAENPEDS